MIGVIGGNGVAATNRLCQLVEDKVVKAGGFRDCHHPEMIIWQATQVPSRSMYLEGRGESFIPGYIDIGKKLKECGCDEICMCCNTAHFFIDELQRGIGLPFINLIELVALKIKSTGVKKVGLMCSDGLAKVKFYDTVFGKICPEVEIVYPDSEYQKLVTKGICNAKNLHRLSSETDENSPSYCFDMVVNYLIFRGGVDCVVAGCTDINNVYFWKNTNCAKVSYVDSLEVLAEYITDKNKFLPNC